MRPARSGTTRMATTSRNATPGSASAALLTVEAGPGRPAMSLAARSSRVLRGGDTRGAQAAVAFTTVRATRLIRPQTQTDPSSRVPRAASRVRSPLSEAEAERIGYSPTTHRTCPRCGHVVQDIHRHYGRSHLGHYKGPLRDADDPAAQQHLRTRRP